MTQVGAKQLEDLQNKQDKDGVTVCSAEVTDSPLGKIFFILNNNGSQLKNPDISGALYTLRIQY